jgi:hypothetical protein
MLRFLNKIRGAKARGSHTPGGKPRDGKRKWDDLVIITTKHV